MAPHPAPVFGRLLTAMVTPFDDALGVDHATARELATHLVDTLRNDGLVVNGTTGESPTTTAEEKVALIRTVVEAVGDRAQVIANVGSYDTAASVEAARRAADAGADGLLVVTPYYSRPPQPALLRHFSTVADAVDLPVMLYDIPHRAGAEIATETLVELATHPRIVAVKDAKGRLDASSEVMARSDLAFYSGDDALTLPLLSVGGAGVVGTSTHFTGALMKDLIEAYLAGEVAEALRLHRLLLPVFTGVFATQGCAMVKAGLAAQGRPAGSLRLPMIEAPQELREAFAGQLAAAGLS